MMNVFQRIRYPCINRHFSSLYKDPIDDTKSTLQISLEYLIKGRYLRSNPIPHIRFAKNGTLLRHQFLRKYKEDLVHPKDVLLSVNDKVSFYRMKESMNGSHKCSLFVWPPEGPIDVCNIIKTDDFNDHYMLKALSSQNENFKIKSYVFMSKDISWRFALQDVIRERRIWWKRHFFNPGSIFIPEEFEFNSEFPVARISTNFEDQNYGFNDNLVVESLKMLDDFQGYKVLETSTCPSIGTLALLLDSVRERMFLSGRPRIALNQHIVPHQLTIFMSEDWRDSSPQVKNNLSELRVFLSKALRKEGLRLYSTPQESLDVIDLIGVPFVIILSPKTLEDGKDERDKRVKSSLRRDKNIQKPEEESGCLKTTSGFRKYVGDALAKRLDDLIDEVSYSSPSKDTSCEVKDSGGVRLFSTTEVITRFKEEDTPAVKREKPDLLAHRRVKKKKRKKAINESDTSSEEDEHFKEVAVTPDWVIEQKGVFKHLPKEADEVISNVKSKTKDPKLKV